LHIVRNKGGRGRISGVTDRLAPGDTAPAFTLTDDTGAEVSLSDYAGRKVPHASDIHFDQPMDKVFLACQPPTIYHETTKFWERNSLVIFVIHCLAPKYCLT
jgi:hypothetical protein